MDVAGAAAGAAESGLLRSEPAARGPAPGGPSPSRHHARLASLDIVRGFTVALMVFVDEIGEAYPGMNHSPWDHITVADLVMPWFLFMVGASMALSLGRFKGDRRLRLQGTTTVCVRSLKLFALGLLLQGGGWIGDYQYGYNLRTMRLCGILQRIAWAFLVAALIELWVPELRPPPGRRPALAVFSRHLLQWAVALLFVVLHLALTFGTYVPSWTSRYGWDAAAGYPSLLREPFEIACEVRGAIATPECSAAGYYDRLLFGQDRLGVWMSARMPQCSSCSPGSCPYPAPTTPTADAGSEHPGRGAAPWCYAHIYDPEGALASLPAVTSVWLGAHYARALRREAGPAGRGPLLHWGLCSAALLAAGLALQAAGLPMNKQLWSPSYLLCTAGSCGGALALVYAAVDAGGPCEQPAAGCPSARGAGGCSRGRARQWARLVLFPLQAMGMNAILVFFWHGTAEALLAAAYVAPPLAGAAAAARGAEAERERGALVGTKGWIHEGALGFISDAAARQLVFVLLKVVCFLIGTWLCYRRGYFWKI